MTKSYVKSMRAEHRNEMVNRERGLTVLFRKHFFSEFVKYQK